MLRPGHAPWWQRLFADIRVPACVPVRPASARRCPECGSQYEVADHYCPGCHFAVPEWQFG